MAIAKGSALKATLEFVRTNGGEDVLANVLDALPDADRTRILKVGPTEEIPFALLLTLWHAADAPMRAVDEQWMERAGAYSIDSLGSQLYGNIIRKGSAIEFLTQPIKLFRLFYHSGDMVVVEQEPGRAILRMIDFDEPDKLFCRRQSGGLKRAVELANGASAEVRHVRCVTVGDAFCEWEIVWPTT